MPFFILDRDRYLLGLMNVPVTTGRMVSVLKTAIPQVRRIQERTALMPDDVGIFDLEHSPGYELRTFCMWQRGPTTQEGLVSTFRQFIPNLFYADDLSRGLQRRSMPEIEVANVMAGDEVRLAEYDYRHGLIPRRYLTSRQWYTDPLIERWRSSTLSPEEQRTEQHRINLQFREIEDKKRRQEKAKQLKEHKELIARSKNSLCVVRKVRLD